MEEYERSTKDMVDKTKHISLITTNKEGMNCREGINKHPLLWMIDYASGEGLSEEEEMNMAFNVYSDHLSFKKVVKLQSGVWL